MAKARHQVALALHLAPASIAPSGCMRIHLHAFACSGGGGKTSRCGLGQRTSQHAVGNSRIWCPLTDRNINFAKFPELG